jgi:co-chaperonin GroES (HSP10)
MTEFDVSAVDLSSILNTSAEQKAKQIPDPQGFMLLTVVPEAMEEYAESESGIIKSSGEIWREEMLTPVLFVIKMGPEAYKDEKRFPSGPRCKIGDFVIVRPNTGTRLKIHGREFRIIYDEHVEAVVEDPRGITRAA